MRGRARLYLFWHFLFSLVLALLVCPLVAANPAGPYIAMIVAAGTLIDVDHLLVWDRSLFSKIFPTYFPEGLTFAFRRRVYPMILHLWLWPLLLVAVSLLIRDSQAHRYLSAGAAGWAFHLTLDGVLVLL